MTDKTPYVECCKHGRQQATFVCQHIVQSLQDGKPRGFWWSQESPDNPRPDAWCSECEEVVNRVGEWNDESEAFAGVRLLCGACYDRAKALNAARNRHWWAFWR
ncbi:MAG: hypothetical protein R3175_14000 [Marinobacter sp.]|uniref:hypothetical protein n=1 Tax=Marinobacter sp. TaxID=50741 RepID=UPI00299E4AAC|nr:hypothetical protein [Marinobacter sp.]MDX1757165.1 hypothetical protein [Marinobacter sp.]